MPGETQDVFNLRHDRIAGEAVDAYIERLRAKVERDFRWDEVARERALALIEEARESRIP